MAPSKRQTTQAKRARELAVLERRARKQQKKDDRKQAAADARDGIVRTPETPSDDEEATGV